MSHAERLAVLINFLAINGVEIGNATTGAIRLPNGRTAFVHERESGILVLTEYYSHGTCRGTYKTRERLLRAIRSNVACVASALPAK